MKAHTDKTSNHEPGYVQAAPAKAPTLKLGMDVHMDRYVVVRPNDGNTPQPAQTFPLGRLSRMPEDRVRLRRASLYLLRSRPLRLRVHRELTAPGATRSVIRRATGMSMASR
jgi:hypothetical protein